MVEAAPLTEAEKKWLQHFERRLEELNGNRTLTSPFLDPRQLELAETKLQEDKDLSYTVYGGYPDAERNLLFIFPSQQKARLPELDIIQVSWNDSHNRIGHRDFLGAVLALGLKRDQVGDIILTEENQAYLFLVTGKGEYICASLFEVNKSKVSCALIEVGQLPTPRDDSREIRGTVASLRLDAVVSIGFKLPRSRVVLLIKAGLARVNWRPVNSPSLQLKEGDQVSLRGRGRLVVDIVEGETRKGRIHLKLKKYL
jgi:RNA-binding protein YlmH